MREEDKGVFESLTIQSSSMQSPLCLYMCVYLITCSEKEYKVAIKDAARIDMYSLKMFLAGRNRDLPQNTIQALDIALREFPTSE